LGFVRLIGFARLSILDKLLPRHRNLLNILRDQLGQWPRLPNGRLAEQELVDKLAQLGNADCAVTFCI